MNEVIKCINDRVSLRKFKEDAISEEHMKYILQSSIKAPTAGNMMLYSIIKITDFELKEKLSLSCDNQPFIKNAPVLLVYVADFNKYQNYFKACNVKDLKEPSCGSLLLGINDALISAQNAVIVAESLGIGSCYIGDMMENYEYHKELLNLPKYTFPVTMLTLGYYPDDFKRKTQTRFKEKYIVFENKYKTLNDDELKDMFKEKDNKMPCQNKYNAENFGQYIYSHKINTGFSQEMSNSILKYINEFM